MARTDENWRLSCLGCSCDHIASLSRGIDLHKEAIEPWHQLVRAADAAGFDLTPASGFRSYERQLAIWNGKLSGERVIVDDSGRQLDINNLSPLAVIKAVLRWSALPGASRHHWGTDIDIYDRKAVPADYRLQLVPDEYDTGGPFAPMITWLHDYLQQPDTPDFYFPYREDRGGLMPEPWHLSYRPLAAAFQRHWSVENLLSQIADADILERSVILENFDHLYENFIKDAVYS